MGESSGGGDRPWQSYHTVYTNAKAGMDGVDKEKVQRIVYETSKGSKYFANEMRKEVIIKQKTDNLRDQCLKIKATDMSHFKLIADKRISELEAGRNLSKIWLHVDMDAFYAAVETLEDPSLAEKPLAVGNMSMISTANYEARRFGVRAAMPGFIARKLCPNLIFVPTNIKKYSYFSKLTRDVFQEYDENFIASSLDEAYLDIALVCEKRGVSGADIAKELRNAVFKKTGLTCSAGVAPNRLLAKVCSDINKPNGQYVLPNNRMAVITFISSLPIRKIGGIGKVTEHVLRNALGINTCEEMLEKSAFICALFSKRAADFFLSVGLGLGKTDCPEFKLRKSISSERTFPASAEEQMLFQKLVDISETLSDEMQNEGLYGRTLTLKIKTSSFEVRTRAISLQMSIYLKEDIFAHASKLLKAELPLSLRLIGLRMSQLNCDNFSSVDPVQKTIADFVVSRDSYKRITDLCNFQGPEIESSDVGSDISLFSTNNELCDPSDSSSSLSSRQLSHLDLGYHTLHGDSFHLQKEEWDFEKIKTPNPVIEETSDLVKEASNVKITTDQIPSTVNRSLISWIDDYKCSLCGAELPPTFAIERQEHSDYHFAQMIQKRESICNISSRPQSQRIMKRQERSSREVNKKKKSTAKDIKHLPIEMFFTKDNQNIK